MSDGAATAGRQAFESASELRQAHGLLLDAFDSQLDEGDAARADTGALSRLEPRIREFIERGAATGVYLAEVSERTSTQVLLDYWVSSLARAGIGAPPGRLASFDAAKSPDLNDKPCPYVGLDAFRDPTFFFGRESDTRALLEQVDRSPLVVVVGASGSGKSSLVMGGLVPALASRPGALRIAPAIVPGNAVLVPLALAALRVSGGDTDQGPAVAARLREEPHYLAALLGGVGAPSALIIIDQFEEVFTLAGKTEREALAAGLASLLEARAGHRIILTMREEFRTRLVELRALAGFLENAWYSMRPMGYEELRAAVERPAAAVNLQFQPGIVDDVVKKVLGQPAALPLLQFTLRTLWDRRDRNRVTWEVYREVGDPLTSLQASADAFYDSRPPETQREVKRILLELVRIDELLEAYRQPLPKNHLLRAGQANTDEVLRILAEGDYLRVTEDAGGEDAIVEVKHESLIRNWPRLVSWIDEKRIERRQRIALTHAAERWAQAERPTEGLLTGWQLEEAKRNEDLAPVEREFVDASTARVDEALREREAALNHEKEQAQAQAQRERRLRRLAVAGAATVAVTVVVMSGVIFWLNAQQSRALERLERLYFAAAASDDPLTQALLLAELGASSEPEALVRYVQLFQDVAATAIPSAVLDRQNSNGGIVAVRFGAEGRIATVAASGVLQWWSVDGRGGPSAPVSLVAGQTADSGVAGEETDRVDLVALSADGHWVAIASSGSVRAGPTDRASTGQEVAPVSLPSGSSSVNEPSALALSASGDRLAMAQDGNIYLWIRDAGSTYAFERTLTGTTPIDGLDFDHAGTRVAAASVDGVIRVWTVDGEDPPTTLGPVERPGYQAPRATSVAFSADSAWLVAGYQDNVARIWSSLDTARPPLLLEGHTGPVTHAAFGPEEPGSLMRVATASSDQTARLWTVRTDATGLHTSGAPILLKGHAADVRALAFGVDGSRLATGSADGTTRIWWTTPQEPRLLGRHDDEVNSAEFSPSGTRVVTASWDDTARIWMVENATSPIVLTHASGVRAAAFNPQEESQVATGSQDGRLAIWNLTTRQPTYDLADAAPGAAPLLTLAYSREATQIAAASSDHEARIWRLAPSISGTPSLLPHPVVEGRGDNWVFDVAFNPENDNQVVTAAGDGKVRLWSDGKPAGPCGEIPAYARGETSRSEDTRVLRAIFVAGDSVIAATARALRVWQRTGAADQCWQPLPWEIRHGMALNDVVVGPDNLILTASDDGTARLSDARDGNRVLTLRNGSQVKAVAFDPMGRHVATGDVDGVVRLWRVTPAALAQYLAGATTACLTVDDRRRFLSESDEEARQQYDACAIGYGRRVQPLR